MWQPVFMISGYFISILGISMLIPAAYDIYLSNGDWSSFLTSSIICLFIGLSLFLANNTKIQRISIRQAYLLTVVSWTAFIVLGTIPFSLYGVTENFADALFESASAVTTTGSTIFADVEKLPKAVLLWRALLSALGGVGIVIFAAALMPFLGIGGMAIFQRENSDVNEKMLPKISYIAKIIISVYLILLGAAIVCLHFAGMSWFEAVCQAMTTISTCGLSTRNSYGSFNSLGIDMVTIVFMLLGAIPLTYYHSIFLTRNFHSLRAEQVVVFLKVLFFYILFTTLWLNFTGVYGFWESLHQAAFNVISVTTTTGYATTDYLQWGALAGSLFVVFSLTGGCTGSTTGSIKILRWQVIFSYLKRNLILSVDPNRVVPVKIGQANTDKTVVNSVIFFIVAYLFCLVCLTLAVALSGYDFFTALGVVLSNMTNTGPGVMADIGPSGNYSWLNSHAKYLLSFSILLGRLDVITILVLFSKGFWQK